MKLLKMVLLAALAPAIAVAQPTTQPDQPSQPTQPSDEATPQGAGMDKMDKDTDMANATGFGLSAKPLSAERRSTYGGPKDAGLLVTKVDPGGAAASAGIRVGDVITKIDDQPMANADDLSKAWAKGQSGEKASATIQVVRDRQTKDLQLNLKGKADQKSAQPQGQEEPKGGY